MTTTTSNNEAAIRQVGASSTLFLKEIFNEVKLPLFLRVTRIVKENVNDEVVIMGLDGDVLTPNSDKIGEGKGYVSKGSNIRIDANKFNEAFE